MSTSACNPEPAQSKKGKYRFSVGTPNRIYQMFCDTEKGMQQWVDKISKAIDNISNGGSNGSSPAPESSPVKQPTPREEPVKQPESPKPVEEQPEKVKTPEPSPPPKSGISIEKQSQPSNESKLDLAKNAIPFLAEEDSKVFEFWSIWSESIPTPDEVGNSGKLEYTLAVSASKHKLTWRSAGPQNSFIQKMVDFFWNVGAPESEIDKLNDVGALINPLSIGSWIDMSAKGGMDGGWYFPVSNTVKLALSAGDPGDAITTLGEWAEKHNISESPSVGRDMGAAPPRQTEIFLTLPGGLEKQVEIALDAFDAFKIPSMPENAISVLKEHSNPGISLSVITSSEGFVRIGILVPNPSKECVDKLCDVVAASSEDIHDLEKKISCKPTFVEYQHLTQGFGYGVYNEGFDVVFHYSLSE